MIAATTIMGISAVMLVVFDGSTAGSRKAENMNHSTQNEREYTNHLRNENSPYLLSHADNPVDWYPWGDEALQRARDEDKPIFLSIGYAACHWCHVMERESFEDKKIAAILNESFVSIKVDREQRPDLDNIYMSFTTALTGSGGWPMSVFLTPDLKPFFAGTYFPPEDRYGRPGFKRLITEIARAYRQDKEKIISLSESIMAQLSSRINAGAGQGLLTADLVSKGADGLMQGFDHAYGGFGQAPKFPQALELSLFLRHYRQSGDISFLQAALKALKGMADGGIYDHIGGGFARYSTDQKWLVPHFEKMLYDNSLLVPVYVEAYQVTGDSENLETVRGTLEFVLREMTDKSGGFYSSLDADSEHEEGKFYIWSKSEVDSLLGDEADLFCRYYNITEGGNFEGRNILNITADSERLRQSLSLDDFDQRMAAGRAKLLEARPKRVRPATDDKILSSWNGLTLYALCKG
ncbi:MAG: thioredoxin domain-containing protein, partial [Planctomycetota bacterium]